MTTQTPKGLWRLLDVLLDCSVFGAYTHIGYLFRKRFFDPKDIPEDLSGLDIMVTGANAGLGFATTKALARRGAHVIMACRNASRAESARDAILQEHPDANISVEIVDVSVLADVRRCCTRLKE
ncbi:MAG TPA: hypothetical protein DCE42_07465, partial [Myxococcales bacterium]|nr:hypothetical protein [Myxococcales bacterium]